MDGYMENAQGHFVPVDQVKPVDLARHELVMEKVDKAKAMQEELAALKGEIMNDVEAFVSLSAEQYGVKIGGQKGNVSLVSYDGQYQIKRQISEHLDFDERLQAAKSLIDECLKDWTEGSPGELRAVVNDAFQVDKEGKINVGRILGLRRLQIMDERWRRAMEAISDSIRVTGTKAYFRIYERNANGKMAAIPLDIAAL
ncbi:DUF3164 family protein [Halodesulfovibrio sp. MK-HDV]|jgi:uncharacterized protein DUF3164|uniref:DUF3164 family protein n=1 Tax=Halodesulfovibrio sp. MK-HDV TaxID=2599925 RepID=UPI001370326C|nr:DUF3164 family protein [Halodesulfovibrio sp. MK-HDV]KAF1073262.1 hypothetical protein MKHDV_03721 [Halodesulfovibrio sp. MK-HDV]